VAGRGYLSAFLVAAAVSLPFAAVACPPNSVWLGDSWSDGSKTRHCQCFPGFIPKGDSFCAPHDAAADARRLPDKTMALVAESFDLGLPGLDATAKALQDRIGRADPFESDAQQALSFVEGMQFMDSVKQAWSIGPGRPVVPSELAKLWAKLREDEDSRLSLPRQTDEPEWLIWMRFSRLSLVDEALNSSGFEPYKAEAYLRERLEQSPRGPRMNAYRFVQGMLLYMSSR
jgi:hypothetical protein